MSRGRVYLDIMGAFTVLGELRMAMPNKWEAVDRILQAQGVRHKEAFRFELHLYYLIKIYSDPSQVLKMNPSSSLRRCHKPMANTSHRSHISLTAVRILAENGLVR